MGSKSHCKIPHDFVAPLGVAPATAGHTTPAGPLLRSPLRLQLQEQGCSPALCEHVLAVCEGQVALMWQAQRAAHIVEAFLLGLEVQRFSSEVAVSGALGAAPWPIARWGAVKGQVRTHASIRQLCMVEPLGQIACSRSRADPRRRLAWCGSRASVSLHCPVASLSPSLALQPVQPCCTP